MHISLRWKYMTTKFQFLVSVLFTQLLYMKNLVASFTITLQAVAYLRLKAI